MSTVERDDWNDPCANCPHPRGWHLFHPGHHMSPAEYPDRKCNVAGCDCANFVAAESRLGVL